MTRSMNELLDEVDRIYKEHGFLTGQEFLDLTKNDMPLYHAYLSWCDAVIIPEIAARIESEIAKLKEVQRKNGWE